MRDEGPMHVDQQDEDGGRPNSGGYRYIYKSEPNDPFRILDR